MSKPFNIIGIGEVLWDMFPDGPRFGGAPANMACAIAGLAGSSAKVTMVSAVGNDILGTRAIDALNRLNVDVSAIQQNDYSTGTVTVNLNETRQATYLITENCAWDHIVWCQSLVELATTADAICFGTLAQRSEKSRNAIQKTIHAMPSTTLKVFDINLREPFFTEEIISQSLELANVLKLNEDELPVIAQILDMSGDTNALIQQIKQQYNLNSIALTKGAQGSVILHNDEQVSVPIVPTTVVDTVGAGDSFTAALTLGLLKQKPLKEIALFASEVSSFVCSKRGGTPQLASLLQE